jgi:hypothetical protein
MLTLDSCPGYESFDWTRIKELDRLCEKTNFPSDEEFYPAFTGTGIHWRRSEEEHMEEEPQEEKPQEEKPQEEKPREDLATALKELSISRP